MYTRKIGEVSRDQDSTLEEISFEWREVPENTPNSRRIEVKNLNSKTKVVQIEHQTIPINPGESSSFFVSTLKQAIPVFLEE
jgi:hypothetical protein